MSRKEFSNGAYRVVREPGGLRVIVPVKPDRFRAILNLVWLVVWAAGEIALVLFLRRGFKSPGADSAMSIPLASIFLATFTVAGGGVLWRWLWSIGGRETFMVVRGAILARREIFGMGRSRQFTVAKIRNVKATRLKYRVIYPSWGRMFIGHDESQIVINYAGRTFAYGKGLEEVEAGEVAGLLEEELSIQPRGGSPPQVRPAFFV